MHKKVKSYIALTNKTFQFAVLTEVHTGWEHFFPLAHLPGELKQTYVRSVEGKQEGQNAPFSPKEKRLDLDVGATNRKKIKQGEEALSGQTEPLSSTKKEGAGIANAFQNCIQLHHTSQRQSSGRVVALLIWRILQNALPLVIPLPTREATAACLSSGLTPGGEEEETGNE